MQQARLVTPLGLGLQRGLEPGQEVAHLFQGGGRVLPIGQGRAARQLGGNRGRGGRQHVRHNAPRGFQRDHRTGQGAGIERATQPVKSADVENDRFIGQAVVLSDDTGVQAQPRITCLEAGCISVWSDESHGVQAAYVGKDTGEVLWRKNIAPQGSRPSIGRQGNQAALVWYENDRVRIAPIDAAGAGESSVVGWVKGLQPCPEVVGGAEPGQWYISWRAYEAAVFEPFVARVDCD